MFSIYGSNICVNKTEIDIKEKEIGYSGGSLRKNFSSMIMTGNLAGYSSRAGICDNEEFVEHKSKALWVSKFKSSKFKTLKIICFSDGPAHIQDLLFFSHSPQYPFFFLYI